jgi:acyl-coenzyme A thioesterase PaaI-like protein
MWVSLELPDGGWDPSRWLAIPGRLFSLIEQWVGETLHIPSGALSRSRITMIRDFTADEVRIATDHDPCCIGCGSENDASLRFRVTGWSAGELRGTVTFTPWHLSGPGHAHGGVTAIALDEAMGTLAVLHFGEDAVTAQFDIAYTAAAPSEGELEIVAPIESVEGRKAWVTGEMLAGTPVATARGLFIRARPLEDGERADRP